jgi:hypothetical protein
MRSEFYPREVRAQHMAALARFAALSAQSVMFPPETAALSAQSAALSFENPAALAKSAALWPDASVGAAVAARRRGGFHARMGAYPTSPRSAFLEWCQAHSPVFTDNAAEIGLSETQANAFATALAAALLAQEQASPF